MVCLPHKTIHPTNHSYRPPDPTMLLTPYTIAVASSPKHCYSLTHTSCISICIGILKPSSTHRGIQTPGLCKPHDRRQWICSGLPVALRRHMQHPQHPTQPNRYHPISQKQSHQTHKTHVNVMDFACTFASYGFNHPTRASLPASQPANMTLCLLWAKANGRWNSLRFFALNPH